MDDHHLSNITKLKKQLLLPSHLGYKQNLLKKHRTRLLSGGWKKIPRARDIHGFVHT